MRGSVPLVLSTWPANYPGRPWGSRSLYSTTQLCELTGHTNRPRAGRGKVLAASLLRDRAQVSLVA
jgi:hypothetical protein